MSLTHIVLDKPGQALPFEAPGNLTPTQGATIVSAAPSQGTCSIVYVEVTPSSPPPLSSRSYGERVMCDLNTIAAASSATVAIRVSVNLNSFVVIQPAGAVVDVAQITSSNDPNRSKDIGASVTTLMRCTGVGDVQNCVFG